jgi:hypothetical protein
MVGKQRLDALNLVMDDRRDTLDERRDCLMMHRIPHQF